MVEESHQNNRMPGTGKIMVTYTVTLTNRHQDQCEKVGLKLARLPMSSYMRYAIHWNHPGEWHTEKHGHLHRDLDHPTPRSVSRVVGLKLTSWMRNRNHQNNPGAWHTRRHGNHHHSLDHTTTRSIWRIGQSGKAENINQSINQTSIAPISPERPGSVAWQPNQCSIAKSMTQFHGINGLSDVPVYKGERPSQRDVSSDVSWR